MHENHILKYTYRSQLELSRLGLKNWCNYIEDILIATYLQYVWDNQVIDVNIFAFVKEKLQRDFMNTTLENIHNSHLYPKLRTYQLFKHEYKLEMYLTHLKDLHYIKALTRFRISSHNLRIKTGRYERERLPCVKMVKLESSKRICRLCNFNNVEDEIHFLLE